MKNLLQCLFTLLVLVCSTSFNETSAQTPGLEGKLEKAQKARDKAKTEYDAEKAKADKDAKYHDPRLGELKKALDKAEVELKPLITEKAKNDAQKAYDDAVAARKDASKKNDNAPKEPYKNDNAKQKADNAAAALELAEAAEKAAEKALEKAKAAADLAVKEKAVYDAEEELKKAKATENQKKIDKAKSDLDIAKKALENARTEAVKNGHIQKMIVPGEGNYCISFSGAYTFPKPPARDAFGEGIMENIMQGIFTNPEVFEQLHQTLGGEFVVGNFNSTNNSITATMNPGSQWGIGLSRYLTDHCVLGITYQQRNHTMQAAFPVSVFKTLNISNQTGPKPHLISGQITAPVQFQSVGLQNTWVIGKGRIQPYAGAGLQWQWMQQGKATAFIEGQEIPLPIQTSKREHGGLATVSGGLQINLNRHFSIALEGQLARDLSGGGSSGIGLRIGGYW